MKLNLNNFRGPFVVKSWKNETIHDISDSQGEHIAAVTAPDDNTHGIKFGKDHAELFGKSFELLEALTETQEIANHAELTAEQKLEAIRAICGKFI